MLIYRILCAILMAWAVNWALSRPEGEQLLTNMPDMRVFGPIAGAAIGFFSLSVRQGWGFVVAFANGIWAGVLSILLSGVLYIAVTMFQLYRTNVIKDFDSLMLYLQDTMGPMLDELVNLPLLIVSLGATAIVGVLTEVIHWVLVKVRAGKGGGEGQTRTSGP